MLYRFARPLFLLAVLALVPGRTLLAQPADHVFRFLDPSGDIQVEAEVLWGTIHVIGHDSDEVRLRVTHTPEGGEPRTVADIAEYIQVESRNTRLRIAGRAPASGRFESIDLTLMVPARADLAVRVSRGGEIRVEDMAGLVNVSHRNGSVELHDLAGPALVNAVNGSIAASFTTPPTQAMSFITLNGEVDLTLPASARADVQLRTERNGYIDSDFTLPDVDYPYAAEAQEGTAKPLYSERPIAIRSTINGGGPPLVATTENGPIRLRIRR